MRSFDVVVAGASAAGTLPPSAGFSVGHGGTSTWARIRVKCEVLLLQTLSLLSSFSRHFVVHKPRLPQLATLDPAFNGRRLVARRQQLRLRPIAFDRAPTGIEPELMGMRPARES